MEKRQAIEFLEYLRQDRNLEKTIYRDALNIAIGALKAQLSQQGTTSDLISRQAAVDVLHGYFDGMLDTDTVCPADIYGLFECIPSAQPEYEEVTPEEAASEIASGSMMSAWSWLNVIIQLKQMGYAICRKR